MQTGTTNVLHVIDSDAMARLEPMLSEVAKALRPHGVISTVLTNDHSVRDGLTREGVDVAHAAARGRWGGWSAGWEASVATRTPQVIQHWGLSAWSTRWNWGALDEPRRVFYVISRSDARRIQNVSLGERDQVIAATSALRGIAVAGRHERSGARVEVLPPAVDTTPRVGDGDDADRAVGVVWCGRPHRHADHEVLIDAAGQLLARGVEMRLAFVGRGVADGVWPLLRDRGVAAFASLVDSSRHARLAVRGADVLIIPGERPLVAAAPLLAMASGVPVIVSRAHQAEWFVEDETALRFSPGSAEELAYQMQRVIERRDIVRRLRASAAAYARERHSVAVCVERLLALYGVGSPVPVEAANT